MDNYDPYKIAQQQAYQQAQQQTQNWAGIASAADPYAVGQASVASTASTAPVYNPAAGGITTAKTPNYKVPNTTISGPGAGAQIGEPFKQYPNRWWGDIPQATFGDIINDPAKYTRMWADNFGLGENTERIIQDFAPMPVNFLYGLGLADQFSGPGVNNPMQKQAELQDKLYNRLLVGGDKAQYIDPRQLMDTALNAYVKKDASGNYTGSQNPLAMQFGDSAVPPQTQADNFIKYVASTVANLIPRQSAEAYINILQREKDLFSDYITQNPKVNVTFNKWIKDRLGPSGGL